MSKFDRLHRRPLEPLRRVAGRLSELRPVHEASGRGVLSGLTAAALATASRLDNRLEWGLEAPVVVAVLGATGTGKSKLFNTLAGRALSPSGYKRPTTLAPVLLVSPDLREAALDPGFLPGYDKASPSNGPVAFDPDQLHQLVPALDSGWPDLILVDTPDFDSVLAGNRAAASDVFDRADAVIFVTDAVKYADQASWDYLERLNKRGRAAVILVNRVKNPLSLEDFARRLREAGLDRPLLSLPDLPGLADADLLPPGQEALEELRRQLAAWSGPERQELLKFEAAADWVELKGLLEDELLPGLRRAAGELDSLGQSLRRAGDRAGEDLAGRLAVSISGELKASLIAQIQTLFLKWDLLRYPRRVMALPYTLVRDKILSPLGLAKAGPAAGRTTLDDEIERLFAANREALVTLVHDYNRQAAEIFNSGPVGRGLLQDSGYSSLVFSGEEVRERYARVRSELEAWVAGQAAELAKGLNLGEKMTFYLAQVLSLGLFISIQVHTGGGFSFFDGLVDTVVAPVLSKLTGHAISRDKVKAFEDEAARRHQENTRAILEDQVRAYLDFVQTSSLGLAVAEPLAEDAADLRRAFENLR